MSAELIGMGRQTIVALECLMNLGAECIPSLCGSIPQNISYIRGDMRHTDCPDCEESIRTMAWLVGEAYADYLRAGCLTLEFFDIDPTDFNCEGLTWSELTNNGEF